MFLCCAITLALATPHI